MTMALRMRRKPPKTQVRIAKEAVPNLGAANLPLGVERVVAERFPRGRVWVYPVAHHVDFEALDHYVQRVQVSADLGAPPIWLIDLDCWTFIRDALAAGGCVRSKWSIYALMLPAWRARRAAR